MPPPATSAWPASTLHPARIAGSAVGAPSSHCPPPRLPSRLPDKTLTFSAGARRDPPPRHHCPPRCRWPATSARLASSCAAQSHPTFSPSGRAPPIFTPVVTALAAPALTAQLPNHHHLPAWASQTTRLNLTFPNSPTRPPPRGGSVQQGLSGAARISTVSTESTGSGLAFLIRIPFSSGNQSADVRNR